MPARRCSMSCHPLPKCGRLTVFMLALAVIGFESHAATLVWDANGSTAPNPQDGSGRWVTANSWWNGGADQSWTDGNDAVFGNGSGVAGNYVVTNNSALLQPFSVTFTNPGNYTLTTDGVNAGQLAWTAPGGIVLADESGLDSPKP